MRRVGLGAGAAVAFALLLAPVGAAAAAAVAAPADLGTVLAAPVDPSYRAVPKGVQGFGAVDAMTFATTSGNLGGVLLTLVRERFTRAYRKGWTQQSSGSVILETVVEFESGRGARDLFAQLRQADQASGALFDTPGFDQAYGVANTAGSGLRTSSIAFVKGNLVYIVITGKRTDPGTSLVLDQAARVYDLAPPQTVDPNGFLDSAGTRIVLPLLLLALVAVVGIPLLLLLAGRRLLLARARRRQALPKDRPALWDGARWRSPDGLYWFDGVAWRPVPQAGR